MLDLEDEFGSEESDSESDRILTVGRWREYECSLYETPGDVQMKYHRMKEVNAIYSIHEATKTDVQEGGRVAKRTKTAQAGN